MSGLISQEPNPQSQLYYSQLAATDLTNVCGDLIRRDKVSRRIVYAPRNDRTRLCAWSPESDPECALATSKTICRPFSLGFEWLC